MKKLRIKTENYAECLSLLTSTRLVTQKVTVGDKAVVLRGWGALQRDLFCRKDAFSFQQS